MLANDQPASIAGCARHETPRRRDGSHHRGNAVATGLLLGARVRGTLGEILVLNPYAPHYFHWMVVRGPSGRRRRRFGRTPTYEYQLRAFVGACCGMNRSSPRRTTDRDDAADRRLLSRCWDGGQAAGAGKWMYSSMISRPGRVAGDLAFDPASLAKVPDEAIDDDIERQVVGMLAPRALLGSSAKQ